MKKQLILFAVLICCLSCASQKKEVIAKSTIKLEGKKTNIRDLLDIDGIYGKSFIFFEDGTWVSFFMKENGDYNENDSDNIGNLFDYVYTKEKRSQIRWGAFWGVYSLQNDTIIVHEYENSTWYRAWQLVERRCRVIDRQTIQWIYWRGLLDIDKQYYNENNISPWEQSNPLHFTPVDTMPPSDSWLKEEKWIWRNEKDWEAYMQHVEQVKKEEKGK